VATNITRPLVINDVAFRQLNDRLKKLGTTPDKIKEAMQAGGQVIADEAYRLAPKDTGAMAKTIKVAKQQAMIRVTVGSTKVPYAYTFHAADMKSSYGHGMTYRVPPHRRSKTGNHGEGGTVKGYTSKRSFPSNPFLFNAARSKKRQVFAAYVEVIGKALRG
jgi:hypothetical protein